jgi:hypothetical protein
MTETKDPEIGGEDTGGGRKALNEIEIEIEIEIDNAIAQRQRRRRPLRQ